MPAAGALLGLKNSKSHETWFQCTPEKGHEEDITASRALKGCGHENEGLVRTSSLSDPEAASNELQLMWQDAREGKGRITQVWIAGW